MNINKSILYIKYKGIEKFINAFEEYCNINHVHYDININESNIFKIFLPPYAFTSAIYIYIGNNYYIMLDKVVKTNIFYIRNIKKYESEFISVETTLEDLLKYINITGVL